MPLVEVSLVSKRFRRGGLLAWRRDHVLAVDRLSFTVEAGEALCVAGESGSGKTTMARMLVRLETPDQGLIRIDGVEVTTLARGEVRAFRRKVQLVSQNPYDSLNPRFTVADVLAEPLRVHAIGGCARERRELVLDALERVELRPPAACLDRYPHELSGGQRQRVAIARALLPGPALMVLDEPVSMLDVSVKAGIINLLRRIREDTGQAQLVVTHDLAVARYLAARTMVMFRGRLVEIGPTDDVLTRPFHPYTQALVAAIPRTRRAGERGLPSASAFGWRDADAGTCPVAARCRPLLATGAVEGGLLRVGERHLVACCALAAAAPDAGANREGHGLVGRTHGCLNNRAGEGHASRTVR